MSRQSGELLINNLDNNSWSRVPGGWEGPWLSLCLSARRTQRDGPINRDLFILPHLNLSEYLLTNVSHV